jgi:hypothetical protein
MNLPIQTTPRPRVALRLLVVIIAGILFRKTPGPIPHELRKVAGDVLWAAMFSLITRLAFPRALSMRIALVAFVLASTTEFAKLLHTPTLEYVRGTSVGGFFLGHTFLPSNFFSYAVGAALGYAWEVGLFRRTCCLAIKCCPALRRSC